METPDQNHIDKADFDHVYEPSEDSFLLIDALEMELEFIKSKKPLLCLEIGSGSGVAIAAFGLAFPETFCFSTDINLKACQMTKSTAVHNKILLDAINMDLAFNFINDKLDVVIFNPPYVVTSSNECNGSGIEVSWAGGVKGREVTDRVLSTIPKILSENGVFYLLLIEDNIPDEVISVMKEYGYAFKIVIRRRVKNERQLVIKFFK